MIENPVQRSCMIKREKFDVGTGHVVDVVEIAMTSHDNTIYELSKECMERWHELNNTNKKKSAV